MPEDNQDMASTSTSTPPSAPQAEMAPMSRSNRPTIVGPDIGPEAPYPLRLEGTVTKGFGRGARFLGIPTANLPDSSLGPLNDLHLTGIYYGFARVHPSPPTTASNPASAIQSGTSTPLLSLSNPLDGASISAIPAETAPYPPDSVVPGEEAGEGDGEIGKKGKRLNQEDSRVWPMVMSVGWNPYFKNEKITAEVHIMHPFQHDFYGHHMSVLVLGYIRPELNYVSREALIDDINFDVKVALNCLAREGYATFSTDPFLFRRKL
ncbi:riboflavin kinase-domain-containing protein [Naematelia encephala]|uniref:Riboflavin kinase n=1 Tax=Naematelia encephala TaxID=71784 RepID=A0A1Y2B182_9TREE|nr:riboflavin kinase-domain-containing protein [Naematelia encephala]